MKKISDNMFIFPENDVSLVDIADVVKVLPTPSIDRRGVYKFDNADFSKYNFKK